MTRSRGPTSVSAELYTIDYRLSPIVQFVEAAEVEIGLRLPVQVDEDTVAVPFLFELDSMRVALTLESHLDISIRLESPVTVLLKLSKFITELSLANWAPMKLEVNLQRTATEPGLCESNLMTWFSRRSVCTSTRASYSVKTLLSPPGGGVSEVYRDHVELFDIVELGDLHLFTVVTAGSADAGIARELHERKAIESHVTAGVVVRVHALCAAILGLVEGHQVKVDR